MSTHRLSRLFVPAVLCAGVMAWVAEPVSADDAPSDSSATLESEAAESETEAAGQETTEESPAPAGDVRLEGRVIVIGPDGQRREYQLEPSFRGPFSHGPYIGRPGPVARVPRGSFGFGSSLKGLDLVDPETDQHVDESRERFLLGLHCTPADETLQTQLGLEARGLVVRRVVPGMPAALAGLQEHDVLLSIGDEPLNTIEELMEALQGAGASPIEMTFLRAGAEKSVEMTPVLRDSLFTADGRRNLGDAGGWLRSRRDSNVQIPSAPYRLGASESEFLGRDRPATDGDAGRIDVSEPQIDERADQIDDSGETLEDGE